MRGLDTRRGLTELLCRRLKEHKQNVQLIQDSWTDQGTVKGMGRVVGTISNSTFKGMPRVCNHAQGLDVTPLPIFCHGDLAVVEV
ncbi:hypothetical protein JTB14_003054 [Gonioctena quinquepunctata]|nr:hypothetical protein JTB14_003054 [Gonioctena quinquepunctata]